MNSSISFFISDCILTTYAKKSLRLTEREPFRAGPVLTNALDWNGHRALRAKKKSFLEDVPVFYVKEDNNVIQQVEDIE